MCHIFATHFKSIQTGGMIAKYDERGKYLPILLEATYDNYFIVKCLLISSMTRAFFLVYLLTYYLLDRACGIRCNTNSVQTLETKNASNNLRQLYFQTFSNCVLLFSIHLYCLRCFYNRYVFNSFVFIRVFLPQTFDYF